MTVRDPNTGHTRSVDWVGIYVEHYIDTGDVKAHGTELQLSQPKARVRSETSEETPRSRITVFESLSAYELVFHALEDLQGTLSNSAQQPIVRGAYWHTHGVLR